jgi:hypothetical protein
MLPVSALLLTVAAVSAAAAQAQPAPSGPEDRAAIEQVARDYLEGWYTADAERLGRALHPDLVKRYVGTLPGGRQVVHSVSREVMVEMTRGGGGSKSAASQGPVAVEILALSGDIAAAKATSAEYVELLSLAKCNGRWAIVNVLWRFQDGAEPHGPKR